MSQRTDFKKFIIRALSRMDGQPMANAVLVNTVRDAFTPKPTMGDVTTALSELETDEYISGTQNRFDLSVTWALTTKGQHQAAELQ